MWVFRVPRLMWSAASISELDSPRVTRARTSRSRGVTPSSERRGAVRRSDAAMSRRVTLDASSASPPATVRIASMSRGGVMSLST